MLTPLLKLDDHEHRHSTTEDAVRGEFQEQGLQLQLKDARHQVRTGLGILAADEGLLDLRPAGW